MLSAAAMRAQLPRTTSYRGSVTLRGRSHSNLSHVSHDVCRRIWDREDAPGEAMLSSAMGPAGLSPAPSHWVPTRTHWGRGSPTCYFT